MNQYTNNEFIALIRSKLKEALDGNDNAIKNERCEKEIKLIENYGFTDDFRILHQISELARDEGQFIYFRGVANNFYCIYILGDNDLAPLSCLPNGYNLPYDVVKCVQPDKYVFEVSCTRTFINCVSKLWKCVPSFENNNFLYTQIEGTRIRLTDSRLVDMYQAMCHTAGKVPDDVVNDDSALFQAYLSHIKRYKAEYVTEEESDPEVSYYYPTQGYDWMPDREDAIDQTDHDLINLDSGFQLDSFEQMCSRTATMYCNSNYSIYTWVIGDKPMTQLCPCFVEEIYTTIMKYSHHNEDISTYFISRLINHHKLGDLEYTILEKIGVDKNSIWFMDKHDNYDFKGTYIHQCRLYCKLAWYMRNYREVWNTQVQHDFCM